jgi:hypothetical protein
LQINSPLHYRRRACLKIKRDFRNPILAGGEGRNSILHNRTPNNEDDVLRLSFKIMKIAASKMTLIQNNHLELLPFCDIEEIKAENPDLAFSLDAVGLFLHSLLEQEKSTAEKQTVKFSPPDLPGIFSRSFYQK